MDLFSRIEIKSVAFPNRVWMSPMCQYSSVDGVFNDWHLVHLGARAVGGVGLVMIEASAVSPEGRISPDDAGLWNESQAESLRSIVSFLERQGAVAGIQLAHAGRKGSTFAPAKGTGLVEKDLGGWDCLAPSAIPFAEHYALPREMTYQDLDRIKNDFVASARRALKVGLKVLEIHAAHGYLLHQFLSPLSNQRQDEFGGSLLNRMRYPLEVVRAVREVWPEHLPLFVRISATDWADGAIELSHIEDRTYDTRGWSLNDSIAFVHELKKLGVDLIDCSTGGTLAKAEIPVAAGYQVPFASEIKKRCSIRASAVGLITEASYANELVSTGCVDAVFLGRELLRNPYWPRLAAKQLGVGSVPPVQYARA